MGGKSARARQHLLFCFAVLTYGSGCSLFGTQKPPQPKVLPPTVIIERLPPPAPRPEPLPKKKESKDNLELSEAGYHLEYAEQLLGQGDFEGSLRESQKVLALAKDTSPSDAALFHMGLVYVHPNNPKKDNKRAIGFFNRVIKSYPESPWVEQAKIWVGVLDGVEKLKQVDIEIEERKRDRTR
jgi:tetratricopeptide (TPR) repeat protein